MSATVDTQWSGDEREKVLHETGSWEETLIERFAAVSGTVIGWRDRKL